MWILIQPVNSGTFGEVATGNYRFRIHAFVSDYIESFQHF